MTIPQSLVGDESDVMRAVYDAWNRLVAVTTVDGVIIKAYQYDGLGRLISESDGTNSTDMYFSGTQVIEERVGVSTTLGASTGSNGTVSAQYVFSPIYVNAAIQRKLDTDGNGTLDQTVYFTSDANFDVTSVISSGGSELQREVYDSYGVVAFKNASFAASSDGYGLQFLYQGMLYDSSIGWYYSGESNNGRRYSPTLQVWGRPDDDGFINGMDPTVFVGDSPIYKTDPKGTDIWISGKSPSDSVPFHQSLCIGDPNGSFQRWEFNLEGSRFEVLNPFNNDGLVETNKDPGGSIVEIIHTTAAQDAEATRIMNDQVGNHDVYRLTYPNCRTFAHVNFESLKALFAPPPPPPATPPPPWWIVMINAGLGPTFWPFN